MLGLQACATMTGMLLSSREKVCEVNVTKYHSHEAVDSFTGVVATLLPSVRNIGKIIPLASGIP